MLGIEKHGQLSEERRYDIKLVINELLVNSFEHAQPSKQSPVVFRAGVESGQLRIGVTDSGEGFSYDHTVSDDNDLLYRERGRGLMLVRALCQEIRYSGRGNSVEVKIVL